MAALTAVAGIAAAGARAPFEEAEPAQEETFTPHVVHGPRTFRRASTRTPWARVPQITRDSLDPTASGRTTSS